MDEKPGSFENANAEAWLASLSSRGPVVVNEAFAAVNESSEPATLLACQVAIAASAIVAALVDEDTSGLPPAALSFAGEHRDRGHEWQKPAQAAVKRVFADSVLRDLWENRDAWEDWEDGIGDLLDRLGQSVSI